MSDIVKFAEIIKRHGIDSEAARKFKSERRDDPIFEQRAQVIETLLQNRTEILNRLQTKAPVNVSSSQPENNRHTPNRGISRKKAAAT